ncbi:MAG: DUF6494 family protein [Gammaproteobacteria bacterium]|nr:DUF6494 family protein [Gammaproteobacteria bacterium]MCI0591469.1 DUF6494 family protein [Gammaproteobacteria bacterium]
MNEDTFNMEIRKFLKHVGVTSQRQIEVAVRDALKAGRIRGQERLKATMRLEIGEIGLSTTIEGHIALG